MIGSDHHAAAAADAAVDQASPLVSSLLSQGDTEPMDIMDVLDTGLYEVCHTSRMTELEKNKHDDPATDRHNETKHLRDGSRLSQPIAVEPSQEHDSFQDDDFLRTISSPQKTYTAAKLGRPPHTPHTPQIAGYKRDSRGDLVSSTTRTPASALARKFKRLSDAHGYGKADAANLIAPLSQFFQQTQASNAPCRDDGLRSDPVFQRPSPHLPMVRPLSSPTSMGRRSSPGRQVFADTPSVAPKRRKTSFGSHSPSQSSSVPSSQTSRTRLTLSTGTRTAESTVEHSRPTDRQKRFTQPAEMELDEICSPFINITPCQQQRQRQQQQQQQQQQTGGKHQALKMIDGRLAQAKPSMPRRYSSKVAESRRAEPKRAVARMIKTSGRNPDGSFDGSDGYCSPDELVDTNATPQIQLSSFRRNSTVTDELVSQKEIHSFKSRHSVASQIITDNPQSSPPAMTSRLVAISTHSPTVKVANSQPDEAVEQDGTFRADDVVHPDEAKIGSQHLHPPSSSATRRSAAETIEDEEYDDRHLQTGTTTPLQTLGFRNSLSHDQRTDSFHSDSEGSERDEVGTDRRVAACAAGVKDNDYDSVQKPAQLTSRGLVIPNTDPTDPSQPSQNCHFVLGSKATEAESRNEPKHSSLQSLHSPSDAKIQESSPIVAAPQRYESRNSTNLQISSPLRSMADIAAEHSPCRPLPPEESGISNMAADDDPEYSTLMAGPRPLKSKSRLSGGLPSSPSNRRMQRQPIKRTSVLERVKLQDPGTTAEKGPVRGQRLPLSDPACADLSHTSPIKPTIRIHERAQRMVVSDTPGMEVLETPHPNETRQLRIAAGTLSRCGSPSRPTQQLHATEARAVSDVTSGESTCCEEPGQPAMEEGKPRQKTACNQVLAQFRDGLKGSSSYYPATFVEVDSTKSSRLKIKFDDETVGMVNFKQVCEFDLRPGDQVRVDENGRHRGPYTVRSFTHDGPVTSEEVALAHTDVYGRRSVIASNNQRPNEEVELPMDKIYITQSLWGKYKDRIYPDPVTNRPWYVSKHEHATKRAATPTQRVSPAAGTAPHESSTKPPIREHSSEKKRSKGMFWGMIFILSLVANKDEKALRLALAKAGALLLDDFEVLFVEEAGSVSCELQPTAIARKFGFTALLSPMSSRSPKYLQALALNIPTLHFKWVFDSIRAGQVLPWPQYLLPAGKSSILGGMERSRTLLPYDAETAKLQQVLDTRSKLFAGCCVMILAEGGATLPRADSCGAKKKKKKKVPPPPPPAKSRASQHGDAKGNNAGDGGKAVLADNPFLVAAAGAAKVVMVTSLPSLEREIRRADGALTLVCVVEDPADIGVVKGLLAVAQKTRGLDGMEKSAGGARSTTQMVFTTEDILQYLIFGAISMQHSGFVPPPKADKARSR